MNLKKKKAQTKASRYAYKGLDRILHERARLGIVIAISHDNESGGLTFSKLKLLCGLTDGNLSRHLQMLEESGVVLIAKNFVDRRPRTCCRLSESGLERLQEYRSTLRQVLDDLDVVDVKSKKVRTVSSAVLSEGQSSAGHDTDSWVPAWDQ